MLRQIARNTAVQILGKGMNLAVSMGTFALITRYLGPALYGRYNVVINAAGIVAIVAELGLTTIAVREIAAKPDQVNRIIPAILMLRVVLGTLAVVASVVLAWVLRYDGALMGLIAAYAATFVIRGIGAGAFGLLAVAKLRAHLSVIADGTENWLYLLIVFVGILTHQAGLAWFIEGTLVVAALNTAIIIALTRRLAGVHWQLVWNYAWSLLREAFPLAIAGFFSTIYFRVDAIMLSKFSSVAAVGIYGVAYRFVETSSMINAMFASSFFPVLAYYFERDRNEFTFYYRKAVEMVAVAGVSLALGVFLFSDTIVQLLNGAAYGEAAGVARICCVAIAFMFVNNIGAHLLYAARQQKQLVWINLIVLLVKVGINWVAIPLYGPAGAAAATAFIEIVIGVLIFITVARVQRLQAPLMALAKLTLVATLTVAIAEVGQPMLWQRIGLMVCWAACLLALGMPKPREVALLFMRRGRA
jgi:O-antigen/teichoic acid export membrane protein